MFSAALPLLQIKDLKDLSVFFRRGYYRHAGPKGPEEMFSRARSRGTGPRAPVCKAASFHRRARACPSPCLGLHGKRPWAACVFRAGRAITGDRPPRYDEKTARHRRARALGCHTRIRAGSPRQRPRNPTRAGDRPPRYGKIKTGRSLLPGKLMSISVPRESLLMPESSPGSSW